MEKAIKHTVDTLIKASFDKDFWINEKDKEITLTLLLNRIPDKKQTKSNLQIILILLTMLSFIQTVIILLGNYHSALPGLFLKVIQYSILMSILFLPVTSIILVIKLKKQYEK